MVIVVVLVIVLIFVPLLLWGLNRIRENRPHRTSEADGRGSNTVVAVLFVFVTLGLGIALPLVILHGNDANASAQVGGVKLTPEAKSGRLLFGQHCAVCHTLSAANAIGKVGPNLDMLKPPKAEVLHVIANGCLPNVTVADENEACLGQGVMPAEVVTGKDAQDVASFVAEAAGH
jgi:Cytochrome C oxidase, cbb3-type, subunit III